MDYGTITPKSIHGIERQLYILSRLQDLIEKYHPDVLAYEEFTWRGSRVRGRSDMERLIGGIQGLTLQPPFPTVTGLLPQKWGAQLVGYKSHTKEQVAFCVNARLRTHFRGDLDDNHACDAVGIALVAYDILRK